MPIHSFDPVSNPGCRVLILGTMPGKASLREGRYYAHPRNLFWKITGAILGFDPRAPYENRLAGLLSAGVALWDVLKSCERRTSLDSDIDASTEVPNDLAAFLEAHPAIGRVCFNGARAEALFSRHVRPRLRAAAGAEFIRLPSTSPANASIPFEKKMAAWRTIHPGRPRHKKSERWY